MKPLIKLVAGICLLLLPGLAPAQKVNTDLLLKQTLEATNAKNYPAAIALARRGLEASPDYTDFRLLLGRLYLLTGRPAEALPELNRVLAKDPRQKDALAYAINATMALNDYPAALKHINAYLGYYADKDMALRRASVMYLNRDFEAGWQEVKRLIADNAGDAELRKELLNLQLDYARAQRTANLAEAAYREYTKVVAIDPRNSEALPVVFNLAVELGQTDDALRYADAIDREGLDSRIRFKKADLLKTENRFDEALAVAESLADASPRDTAVAALYTDVRFAQAKFLLSKADTLAAMTSYSRILARYPADTLARRLLLNLQLTRRDYPAALATLDQGLPYYPQAQEMRLKRLAILQESGDRAGSYAYAKALYDDYPRTAGIDSLYHTLWEQTRRNRVGMTYTNTYFTPVDRKPWNVYSLFYMRQGTAGSLIGRVNYADRFDARGYQFELESYPIHGKTYSYVDVAYSQAVVFPRWRLAYSWFTPLGKSYELEVGARYINSRTSFFTAVAAIARSFNRYWINLKTFATPYDNKIANSYALTGRYYLNSRPEDYFTLIAGYGFSPDDRARNFEIVNRLNLESVRFTGGYQQTFRYRHIAGIFLTWNRQEYVPGRKRNELEGSLSYQFKF